MIICVLLHLWYPTTLSLVPSPFPSLSILVTPKSKPWHISLGQFSQRVVYRPASPTSSGNMTEMQTIGPRVIIRNFGAETLKLVSAQALFIDSDTH